MGLETYLFKVEFETPIQQEMVVELFESIGLVRAFDDGGNEDKMHSENSCYFEKRTDRGLTEVECICSTEKTLLDNFSIRYSVISPKFVVDQTFELLKKLNDVTPIKLFDTEIYNHLYRELGKKGKIHEWLNGLTSSGSKSAIEQRCYIPIDVCEFKQNKEGLAKRNLILGNFVGEIIKSGRPTFEFIHKNGLYEKYIGWHRVEMK